MDTTKLPEKWIKIMVDQPESGMGYQIVRVKRNDGTEVDGMVFNCEFLAGKCNVENIIDIRVVK